ncbi:hypothetical protein LSH36_26g14017 [Paralvinella palmiformis]|uniref:Uncharacterized protein n=1 Tax=Paralvinella palmiformis TaxID=53620 RepID=A0AAD9K9K4_9ANNE|nr:hypothetical protein LSH36_26g14017 [Paralvinella palmiformis]
MTCEKTRNVIYLVTSCFIIVIQGQGIVRDCTSSEIAKCSEIVNFTLLERTNYTITSAFCGDDYFRFKSCMEPLRDLCSAVILQLLDDLISTLMFVCHPQQLILLKNSTACLTSPAVTSHLAQCQKAFKDGIANSNSVGDICQKMVEFLSCSRWSAWASCGRLAAEYVYRLESHWVNKTIGTLGCTTTSREAPSGLLWSYVMQGYTIWNPSTSSIMQLNGDPETWVPEFLRSGNFSRRYIGSKRMARFGHLAADYWHNKLIWVDMTGSTAHYVPIYFFERESIPNTLVFGGMSKNVTAIAVDWVSENLYWADAGYQWIGLVPYKVGHMGHHVILFDEDLLHPSGIITDPAKGSLYWTDMDKGVIERSTLSGHQRRVLYSELSLPTSLAIDYNTSYLYWLGGYRHVIYSAHTDGGAITEVRSEGLTVVYNDLSVYEDYIFVTVNKADLIIYNKINGTKLNKIGVETNRNYEETYAVTVSAPSKQQPINNRCYYDNGDCQQICITNVDPVNSVLCMCTVGYHLATDGKRCQSEPLQDNFIVVADSYGKDLYMISIDGSTVRAIPTAPDSVPQTVVYILENRTILWYDETSSSLKETAIKDFRTRIIHYFGSEKILLQSDIPAAIVLDINQRIIYWTEWRDMFSSPGIYSADMDTGLNKKLLVSTDLYYPSGLNVNFKDKKMFWCDAYTDKIEQYDMMNSERVTLVNKTGATFYSMTMEDDLYLYITDLSSRHSGCSGGGGCSSSSSGCSGGGGGSSSSSGGSSGGGGSSSSGGGGGCSSSSSGGSSGGGSSSSGGSGGGSSSIVVVVILVVIVVVSIGGGK